MFIMETLCLRRLHPDISIHLNSLNLTVFVSACLFHVSSYKNSYFQAFLVKVGASFEFVVSRLGQNLLFNLNNIYNIFLFPIGRLTHTLSSFQLGLRLMVC